MSFHSFIHPQDATNAIQAHINQAAKTRKKATVERILDDLLIASLANKQPGSNEQGWTEEQVREISRRSSDQNFKERFARALEEGRARIFDPVDVFILINWRKLRVGSLPAVDIPGLQDWNPRAACGLIEHCELRESPGEEWYCTRRKRLGLAGNPPYRVKDFIVRANGDIMVSQAR